MTTGISAYDRAHTMQAAVAPDARPEDLRQPGHVFPLMAQPGGVLTRAGHTEAGCDLARLAGFEPAAVIVEILNDDGTMARRPELEQFAREHGLTIGTIADLIRYRLEKERSVERIADREVETESGTLPHALLRGPRARPVHLALVRGAPCDVPPLVRVHLHDTLRDLIGIRGEHAAGRCARRSSASRASRTGSSSCCGPRSSLRDRRHGRTRARRRTRRGRPCCAPTASARRSCATSASRACACCPRPAQLHGLSAFGLEIADYEE